MEQVELDDGCLNPASPGSDYARLLYVWGSPDDTRLFRVDGHPVQVRRNLWDFLNVVLVQRHRGSASSDSIVYSVLSEYGSMR
jgi:hypothetical protein